MRAGDRAADWALPVAVPAGVTVRIGPAISGLRAYVAVGGGITVPKVLGSRATDTLSGLGPPQVRDGDVLPIGEPVALPPGVDVAPYPPVSGDLLVGVRLGPRAHWFTPEAVETLCSAPYTVSTHTDRVGCRLSGPPLARSVRGELRSEGLVLGAVQVPANGQPLIFLADHPTTGGYPVVGVAEPGSVDAVAQARPGTRVHFRPV